MDWSSVYVLAVGPSMVIFMIFYGILDQCCSLLVMLKFLLNLAPEPEPEPEPEMAEYRGSFLCGWMFTIVVSVESMHLAINRQLSVCLPACVRAFQLVCLLVCLPPHWSACLSVHLPTCLFVCLSDLCLSVCLPTCLPACLSINCLPVCLYMYVSCLPAYPPICLSIWPPACYCPPSGLPACLFVCLPVCLSVCPPACLPTQQFPACLFVSPYIPCKFSLSWF